MFNAEVYKRRRSALRKQMTSGIALFGNLISINELSC